ncbi:MAG: DUF2283 domain-containing protein [Eubacteriales bacterium]|nr:DUF2283 domain-containing protein [Eubacteriales bacterium]
MSTLAEIAHQKQEKAIVSLQERYISPVELLDRYHAFYCNAEAVIKPCSVSTEEDRLTKELFKKRKKEFAEAYRKINTYFDYDKENNLLTIHMGKGKTKYSEDRGAFLLEMAENGEVVGIKIFNMML